jgi:mannose-6-phosphate isomerase-like protein (cupin superfamily)
MAIVKRTWGWYFVLMSRKHFKVKILRIARGKGISMQKHSCRSELWLILRGKCESRFMDNQGGHASLTYLVKGDWQNIPNQVWHKLRAITNTWILEIQYGDKCVEWDIVRI